MATSSMIKIYPTTLVACAMSMLFAGCGGGGSGGTEVANTGVTQPISSTQPLVEVPSPTDNQQSATIVLPACDQNIDTASGQKELLQAADWTYLVYMAADNSLSASALNDLQELRAAASKLGRRVNIVIQYETSPEDGVGVTRRELISSQGTQTFKYSNLDMACGANLKDFLRYGKAVSPSQNYALVLWSHGSGWRSAGSRPSNTAATATTPALTKGILDDATSGTFMSIATLRDSIKAAGVPLELIDMDACDMGMIEVIQALAGTARYLVGSEGDVPSLGNQYTDVIARLIQQNDQGAPNGETAGYLLGQSLISSYQDNYSNWASGNNVVDKAFYRLDPQSVTNYVSAVQGVANDLNRLLPNYRDAIKQAREEAYSPSIQANRDLGHFLAIVGQRVTDANLSQRIAAFQQAEQRLVVDHRTIGNDTRAAAMRGVAVFLPNATSISATELQSYQYQMRGTAMADWSNFITNLLQGEALNYSVAGDFSARLTWDNPKADLDLWVLEPGRAFSISEGTNTNNGFFSPDSYDTRSTEESYATRDLVQAGQYRFYVSRMFDNVPESTNFKLCVTIKGQTQCETGTLRQTNKPMFSDPSNYPFNKQEHTTVLDANGYGNWYASSQIVTREVVRGGATQTYSTLTPKQLQMITSRLSRKTTQGTF